MASRKLPVAVVILITIAFLACITALVYFGIRWAYGFVSGLDAQMVMLMIVGAGTFLLGARIVANGITGEKGTYSRQRSFFQRAKVYRHLVRTFTSMPSEGLVEKGVLS